MFLQDAKHRLHDVILQMTGAATASSEASSKSQVAPPAQGQPMTKRPRFGCDVNCALTYNKENLPKHSCR